MSDKDKLREILTMAEVLTIELAKEFVVETYNDSNNKTTEVIFVFDDNDQLIEIFVEGGC